MYTGIEISILCNAIIETKSHSGFEFLSWDVKDTESAFAA